MIVLKNVDSGQLQEALVENELGWMGILSDPSHQARGIYPVVQFGKDKWAVVGLHAEPKKLTKR